MSDRLRFKNKVVIVTGAAQGIKPANFLFEKFSAN